MKPKTVHFITEKYLGEFKHHVYGKRQIQVEDFSQQENELIKAAQNNSYG